MGVLNFIGAVKHLQCFTFMVQVPLLRVAWSLLGLWLDRVSARRGWDGLGWARFLSH